jgi:hypothetical protein
LADFIICMCEFDFRQAQGGLALGTEVCAGGVFAGRVAVALGGGFVWAATS